MKKNIFIICVFFILISFTNCDSNVSKENLSDIKKIKLGMHLDKVDKVMRNKPFKREIYSFEPEEFIDFYDSPLSSSGHFSITYNKKDSIVIRIYKGE